MDTVGGAGVKQQVDGPLLQQEFASRSCRAHLLLLLLLLSLLMLRLNNCLGPYLPAMTSRHTSCWPTFTLNAADELEPIVLPARDAPLSYSHLHRQGELLSQATHLPTDFKVLRRCVETSPVSYLDY